MDDVRISKQKFRESLRPLHDAAWVKMDIESVQGSGLDWVAILKDEKKRTVKIQVTPSQVTHMVPGMKGLSEKLLFASPYQITDRLAQAFGAHSVCVIMDTSLDRIVAGKVELKKIDGERFYLRMAGGDALAYAALMGLPIYMIEDLVAFLSEK